MTAPRRFLDARVKNHGAATGRWGFGRASNSNRHNAPKSLLGAMRRLRTQVVVGLRWLFVAQQILSLVYFLEVIAGQAECSKILLSSDAEPSYSRFGRVAVAYRRVCRDYIHF